MEPFSIQWRNSTKKDIRSLPRNEVARVVEAVGQLANDPLPHALRSSPVPNAPIESASAITA